MIQALLYKRQRFSQVHIGAVGHTVMTWTRGPLSRRERLAYEQALADIARNGMDAAEHATQLLEAVGFEVTLVA